MQRGAKLAARVISATLLLRVAQNVARCRFAAEFTPTYREEFGVRTSNATRPSWKVVNARKRATSQSVRLPVVSLGQALDRQILVQVGPVQTKGGKISIWFSCSEKPRASRGFSATGKRISVPPAIETIISPSVNSASCAESSKVLMPLLDYKHSVLLGQHLCLGQFVDPEAD